MQQTSKYQFKLIEGTDDFSPGPLNDNMEMVEEQFEAVEEEFSEVMTNLGSGGHNARIAWGTYTGNGNYGAANPTTISPGFYPVVVFVGDAGSTGYYGWPTTFLRGCPNANGVSTHSFQLQNVSWSDTSVSWYHTQYAEYQMNVLNTTYYYVAIGYDKAAE